MSTEVMPMELAISEMEISTISEQELETTFQRVIASHKDAIMSIKQSMDDVDTVYKKYRDPNYIPIEEVAKKDRAALNKAKDNIASQFKTLKEAYERPLENIELNIKQICNAIKNASANVDSAVKAYEEKQKAAKRKDIKSYFATKNFDLVPLDRIFDPRWTNKTKPMKEVRDELDEKISAIYRDVEVLEKIPEHGMAAKAFYLDCLDIGASLRQIETLKANAERLIREQAEREARKAQEQVAANDKAERNEKVAAFKQESVSDIIDQALDLPEGETAAQAKSEVITCTLTFSGTKEQLLKLRQIMTEMGIPYRKALVLESYDDAKQIASSKGIAEDIHSLLYVPAA
ncbi:MAG: DUF1351 domain-containing protein [Treponema sp.]|jgi:hypothetical protein|nr:DUF1351 domain-containing protein [Treponema sp.]